MSRSRAYSRDGSDGKEAADSFEAGSLDKVRLGVLAKQPWRAPSVQRLAQQLGTNKLVQPMMVEGPAGTILTAVGEQEDHAVAGEVLRQAQEARAKRGTPMPWGNAPDPNQTSSSMTTAPANAGGAGKSAFAAVYEHRDCFGLPRAVGCTHTVPEQRFLEDQENHQGVSTLMRRGGSSEVVWAGVGSYPLGPREMEVLMGEIAQRRAAQHKVQKLQGPKPYSRHGY